MTLLWRDQWLKPLTDGDAGTDKCAYCGKKFGKIEFVTACDFCDVGVMHDACANKHILAKHRKAIEAKIESHRDRRLHDYQ
jgi:hypothetical protein